MSEPLKLCKDCAHARIELAGSLAKCTQFVLTDYVMGHTYYPGCSHARGPYGHCGPEGKLWRAKDDQEALALADAMDGRR